MNTESTTHFLNRSENQVNAANVAPRCLRFGNFHLDLQREELFKDGTRVRLQGKVYQALVVLVEKPGEIVTREALRMRLWPSDTHVNYDANVNTTVNKLRQALGDSTEQPTFVTTIPRKGYSFVAKVEYEDHHPGMLRRREASVPSAPEMKIAERNSFLAGALSSKWFTPAVISLVIAGMLFGAALTLYAHRF